MQVRRLKENNVTGPRIGKRYRRFAVFLSDDKRQIFLTLQGKFWGLIPIALGLSDETVWRELNHELLKARINLKGPVSRLFVPEGSIIFPSVIYKGETDIIGNPVSARMFYPREFPSYSISAQTVKFVEDLKEGAFMKA